MNKLLKNSLLLLALLLGGTIHGQARDLALKTNILYDAALTVNLGGEVALAPKWSFDLSGNLNAWTVKGHKWKHWMVQPEARYWFCQELQGHFVGAHALGGQYNVGNIDLDFKMLGTDFRNLKDRRYQGWYGGLGVAYGYSWILGRHWNLEAELGLGWIYTKYDVYPCAKCGTKLAKDRSHNYFGPTKVALNIVHVF